ncbi:MAG: ABC transporter substrate-binding protein [Candidatus Heimdallarchaeota archaeon]
MIKNEYAYAGIIIALIIGMGVGWAIRGPGAEVPEAKFPGPDFPPAGTKIIHGMDAAYPPFTEVDPTGKAVGFDVEVVDWIAAKYGWEVEHKAWDWAAIVTAVLEGDLDFVASGMTHTAARAEKVWFTLPYYTYIHQLIVSVDDLRTWEDVLNSGDTISCQLGATSDEWAEKLLAEGYNFEKLALDSYELAFEAVLDGRATGCISDSGFTGPYFKRNPEVAGKLKILSTIGGYEVYAYATRPEDYGLRNALNHALAELMASPEWDAMKEKWGV